MINGRFKPRKLASTLINKRFTPRKLASGRLSQACQLEEAKRSRKLASTVWEVKATKLASTQTTGCQESQQVDGEGGYANEVSTAHKLSHQVPYNKVFVVFCDSTEDLHFLLGGLPPQATK